MTDPNHPSGTDRIFEAYSSLENKNDYEFLQWDCESNEVIFRSTKHYINSLDFLVDL